MYPISELPLRVATVLGVLAGVCLSTDAIVDGTGRENWALNLPGLLVPVLGIHLLTAVFLVLQATRPGALLGVGYLVNAVGLCLVVGIDVTVAFALAELDPGVREELVSAGPTVPAFIVIGSVFTLGAVLYGLALVRRDFAAPASWAYLLTAVPSGFSAVLPPAVGAVAQFVQGLAVVGLALGLRAAVRRDRVAPVAGSATLA